MKANQKGIHLKFEVYDVTLNFLQIEVDTNKFAQVIRNLISNGIKFTPTGATVKLVATILENQPSVAVAVADPKGIAWLRIDVIDSGVGVSKVGINIIKFYYYYCYYYYYFYYYYYYYCYYYYYYYYYYY